MRFTALIGGALAAALALSTAACDGSDDGGAPPAARATTRATTNGIDKLDVTAILDRARTATLAASSVHMSGAMPMDGGSMQIDVSFAGKATSQGTITQGEQKFEFIRLDDAIYVKGNEAFLSDAAGGAAVSLLKDKYIKTSSKSKDFKDVEPLTDVTGMVGDIMTPTGTPTKGEITTVSGRRALELRDGGDSMYVALDGEPRVLRVKSDGDAILDLDRYGDPVQVTAPPAGQIVNIG
ncbi:hypothetical protein [Actinomadura atramentaria]|uniref:hypothetical protein n=1 Tax=Actinomadura atramentaria TaxID=1990 RepID=UPI00037170FB|nr:hypothetical protein [Actinomadura atramentaria]